MAKSNNNETHVGAEERLLQFSLPQELMIRLRRAVDVASYYGFQAVGHEHALFAMADEDEFIQLMELAGGDVALCVGALTDHFSRHASTDLSTQNGLVFTAELDNILVRLHNEHDPLDSTDDDSLCSDFRLSVIASCGCSAAAEKALIDSGAGELMAGATPDDLIEEFSQDWWGEAGFDDDLRSDGDRLRRTMSRLRKPDAATGVSTGSDAEAEMQNESPEHNQSAKSSDSSGTGQPSKDQIAIRRDVEASLRDLGSLAASGALDPVSGRDREIANVVSVLRRKRKSSVILSGEPGVGKTAIAEGVALFLRSSQAVDDLSSRPIYEVSLPSLVAGTKFRGDFEARMNHLIERMRSEKAIMFMDEFHMIAGAGAAGGRSGMDGANIVKTALGRGEITIIGATTPSELRELRRDGAMMRRFEAIVIKEPDRAQTLEILRASAWPYFKFHDVLEEEGILEEICRLTDLYQPEKRFPDKAFDLLDAACVVARESRQAERGGRLHLEIEHVHAAADRMRLRRPRRPDACLRRALSHLEEQLPPTLQRQDLLDIARSGLLDLEASGPRGSTILISDDQEAAKETVQRFAQGLHRQFHLLDVAGLRDRYQLSNLKGSTLTSGTEHAGQLVDICDADDEPVILIEGAGSAAVEIQEFLEDVLRNGIFRAASGRMISLRHAWIFLVADGKEKQQSIGFLAQDDICGARMEGDLPSGLMKAGRHIVRLVQAVPKVPLSASQVLMAELEAHYGSIGIKLSFCDQLHDHLDVLCHDRAGVQKARRLFHNAMSSFLFSSHQCDAASVVASYQSEAGQILISEFQAAEEIGAEALQPIE